MAVVGAVGARDRRLLLDAIAAIGHATALADLRWLTVQAVSHLIPTALAAWTEVDQISGSPDVVVMSPELRMWAGADRAFAKNVADHPVIERHRSGDGRPYAISDFLTVEKFHETALYQQFYRRLRAEDQLSFMVPHTGPIIGVALNRPEPGFSRRDRVLANLFRSHVAIAYRNARAHERVQLLSQALDNVAEQHNEGLIVLGRGNALEYISPSATRILRRWFKTDPRVAISDIFQEWLTSGTTVQAPFILKGEASGQLSIRLVNDSARKYRALLVTETTVPDDRQTLRSLGLTVRQSEVVALAVCGMSNSAIAERLWISTRTVDGHISQGLRRLGVETRTAAGHLLRQAAG